MALRNAEAERQTDARRNSTSDPNEHFWSNVSRDHNQCRPGGHLQTLYQQREDTSSSHLPSLQLFEQPQSNSASDVRAGSLSVLNSFNHGDSTVRPTINHTADNRVTDFTDIGGNHYTQRDGRFFNDRNPAQAEGVDLNMTENGSVRMRDRETGIVRTTSPDGAETTDYSAVNGGISTRRISGNQENIQFQDRGGRERSLVLQDNENGAMIQSYVDGSGTNYTFNNQRRPDGAQLYSARSASGQELGTNFAITADRSGNVLVNNYDRPSSLEFARRELNNGYSVSSDRSGSLRTVQDANGNLIGQGATDSPEIAAALRTQMISDVPRNLDFQGNLNLAQAFRESEGYSPILGTANSLAQLRQLFDGGAWDPKTAGSGNNVANMEYEAYGNWQYGYLGRASGYSKNF